MVGHTEHISPINIMSMVKNLIPVPKRNGHCNCSNRSIRSIVVTRDAERHAPSLIMMHGLRRNETLPSTNFGNDAEHESCVVVDAVRPVEENGHPLEGDGGFGFFEDVST